MRRTGAIAVAALAVGGCGSGHREALPIPCTNAGAVQRAAAAESLPGGAVLSDCITDAKGDADVQSVAAAFVPAADALVAGATGGSAGAHRDARSLGFLVGAAQRPAHHDIGAAAQLVQRLVADRRRVDELAPARDRDVAAGIAAGRARG